MMSFQMLPATTSFWIESASLLLSYTALADVLLQVYHPEVIVGDDICVTNIRHHVLLGMFNVLHFDSL